MWKEVNTSAIDLKKTPDKPYEGTYTGHREITTKIGPQVIWEFADDDGVGFGIYGFTNLNRSMSALKVGTKVKLQYKGKINMMTKFGLKDVHQVSVQCWASEAEDAPPPSDEDDSLHF